MSDRPLPAVRPHPGLIEVSGEVMAYLDQRVGWLESMSDVDLSFRIARLGRILEAHADLDDKEKTHERAVEIAALCLHIAARGLS